jgi:hypothetical protein
MNVRSRADSEGDLSNASTIYTKPMAKTNMKPNLSWTNEDEKDLRFYPDWSHFRK